MLTLVENPNDWTAENPPFAPWLISQPWDQTTMVATANKTHSDLQFILYNLLAQSRARKCCHESLTDMTASTSRLAVQQETRAHFFMGLGFQTTSL